MIGDVRHARSAMTPSPTRPARTLPIPVPLVRGESHTSFMRRLAEANHIPLQVLRRQFVIPRRGIIDLGTLAQLSGHSIQQLDRAILSPPPRRQRRSACARCLSRRGIRGAVEIKAGDHDVICRRHRRWLDTSVDQRHQYDLRPVPEVLTAHRRHRRWTHQLTDSHTTTQAFADARHILFRWTARGDWAGHRHRRLKYFVDLDGIRMTEYHPLMPMVNYPETVALARLLSETRWIELAAWHGPHGLDLFSAQVRQRLRIPYEPYTGHDPLLNWIKQQRRRGRRGDRP